MLLCFEKKIVKKKNKKKTNLRNFENFLDNFEIFKEKFESLRKFK